MHVQIIRVLNASDIRNAVTMRKCIDVMKTAFENLSAGRTVVPQRLVVNMPPETGRLLVMPAYAENYQHAGLKLVSLFHDNPAQGLPLIQAVMLLVDALDGRIRALLDGEALTALRTGGASGLATELLAQENAQTAAIFGAGIQAETQVAALCAVRSIHKILIFGRAPQKAAEFAQRMQKRHEIPVQLAKSPEELSATQIICTATTSSSPVLADKYIADGTHIDGVGSYRANMREVPGETVKRAKVIVDQRAACLAEAGDILIPMQKHQIKKKHIFAELGEVASGIKPGRCNSDEITFFKSVGNAVQDLALAHHVFQTAEKLNLGQVIKL